MSGQNELVEDRPREGAGPLGRLIDRSATVLAIAGGILLIGVSLMVAVSVIGRWLFGREIPGAFEIVQVGVAATGFLFLPICQLRGGNIVVDAFTVKGSARARAGLDALWALLYSAVAAVLAWRLALGAFETIRSGTVTTMIRLPYGWAMVVGAAALVFLAAVAALTAVRFSRIARG